MLSAGASQSRNVREFEKQSRQPYLSELILCQEVQMIFRGEESILTESACVEVFFECE